MSTTLPTLTMRSPHGLELRVPTEHVLAALHGPVAPADLLQITQIKESGRFALLQHLVEHADERTLEETADLLDAIEAIPSHD